MGEAAEESIAIDEPESPSSEAWMASLLSALRNGAKYLERRDDDGFDRLSNRYSVGLLIMLAAFISTKSYVGDPIDCFVPKEFNGQWTKYTDNYCWVSNTYYVPPGQALGENVEFGKLNIGEVVSHEYELKYYQWVPIILAFLCFFFAIPAFIWSWASNSGGYEVEAIVKATKGASSLNPEKRDTTVTYLVEQMHRLLQYRRPKSTLGRIASACAFGKRHGQFLFIIYIVVKILYCANAILQLFLLNSIMGDGYHYYGLEVIQQMNQPGFQGSTRFPYVTFCDMWIRKFGNNHHRYTMQCVLPVNLFNEKVFIVLWFWLVFVAAASFIGLALWLVTAIPFVNERLVKKYLSIMRMVTANDDADIEDFAHDYLRLDGLFTMRLILKNTNDAIGGEIMAALWDRYRQHKKPYMDSTTDNLLPHRKGSE